MKIVPLCSETAELPTDFSFPEMSRNDPITPRWPISVRLALEQRSKQVRGLLELVNRVRAESPGDIIPTPPGMSRFTSPMDAGTASSFCPRKGSAVQIAMVRFCRNVRHWFEIMSAMQSKINGIKGLLQQFWCRQRVPTFRYNCYLKSRQPNHPTFCIPAKHPQDSVGRQQAEATQREHRNYFLPLSSTEQTTAVHKHLNTMQRCSESHCLSSELISAQLTGRGTLCTQIPGHKAGGKPRATAAAPLQVEKAPKWGLKLSTQNCLAPPSHRA